MSLRGLGGTPSGALCEGSRNPSGVSVLVEYQQDQIAGHLPVKHVLVLTGEDRNVHRGAVTILA